MGGMPITIITTITFTSTSRIDDLYQICYSFDDRLEAETNHCTLPCGITYAANHRGIPTIEKTEADYFKRAT